jgi:hypothetical protein
LVVLEPEEDLVDHDLVQDLAAGDAGKPSRNVRARAQVRSTYSQLARFAEPALVNGTVGVVVAPRGRLLGVLAFTVRAGKIVEIDILADPARLRQLDLAVLDD